MTVLAGARGQRYEIGTNLKGAGTVAAWTLLLPRLDLRTAVVLGSVADAELATLTELAERVVVLESDADAAGLVRRADGGGKAEIDLVRVGRGGLTMLDRSADVRRALDAQLSDRASAFAEWRGARPPRVHLPVDDAGSREDLVLRPSFGPARLIVPARHAAVVSGLPGARRASAPAARPGRWRVRAERLANRALSGAAFARWATRGGRLATRGGTGGPPPWVTRIAADAGANIGACGWALLAPGDYATQKVLLVLLDPATDRPRTIVKISASPMHRGRLRAEADALTHLAGVEVAAGHVPVVEFAGEHAEREIVGERWITGRPFEGVARVDADSPHYAAASGWLTSLAAATARQRPAADIGVALRDLFDRFAAAAPLSGAELGALEAEVHAIESHDGMLPTVVQHGDPGTWNLVLDEADRVVFLDWEASEPDGIPLWDLFHLQRSFGALAAGRVGVRGPDASVRHLAGRSAIRDRFASEIAEQSSLLGIDARLIAPLFFTCWMHRALKEVTRRTPATIDRGPYLRFLRTMLARRHEPSVRDLLGGGEAG